MAALRAAIIGCGGIAGGYDGPADAHVLTHAHAYHRHPETELVAVADPDRAKADAFAEEWGVERRYDDGRRMLVEVRPDIVSICSPSDSHALWLDHALAARPRVVWCEKPIAQRTTDAAPIVAAYEAAGVPLAVNYLRRWDPVLAEVGARCRAEETGGAAIKVVVIYGKGLFNNGSHAIDLLIDWFGPVRRCVALSAVADYWNDDPTVTGFLVFENGVEAALVANDERHVTVWEIDVVGPGWRMRLADSGERLLDYVSEADPLFAGYRRYRETPLARATGIHTAMSSALENIVDVALGRGALRSTGATALETLSVCERVRDALAQSS